MPSKKRSKQTRTKTGPERAAEKAKPNWRAIPRVVSESERKSEADVSSPELATLRRKYLGEVAAADSSAGKAKQQKKSDLQMVVLEEKNASDTRVGRKVVLVQKNKIVGEQG